MKQVWFPGVHCDVGGGYQEKESGLAKCALQWMLKEARPLGLMCDEAKVRLVLGDAGGDYAKPNPKAKMHEELKGAWHLAEVIPKRHYNWATGTEERRMNLGHRRTIPPRSLIHISAYAAIARDRMLRIYAFDR
jgi:uncharacterized protein (DUF2235 family)